MLNKMECQNKHCKLELIYIINLFYNMCMHFNILAIWLVYSTAAKDNMAVNICRNENIFCLLCSSFPSEPECSHSRVAGVT